MFSGVQLSRGKLADCQRLCELSTAHRRTLHPPTALTPSSAAFVRSSAAGASSEGRKSCSERPWEWKNTAEMVRIQSAGGKKYRHADAISPLRRRVQQSRRNKNLPGSRTPADNTQAEISRSAGGHEWKTVARTRNGPGKLLLDLCRSPPKLAKL